MLVLSRKAMQSVVIGADIRITVIRVEGNQIRIGIEAPQDVRILRGELLDDSQEDGDDCGRRHLEFAAPLS
ncbi:carbon storage regulator [Paludisphaera mucosa]|uniref:Translational regulator CsrA n=1 Tax=Paludisphaera mucosa TaxID=3030827 RepID=A0ABT6F9X3_9BACT|nr:carbon storage regulator [Paludisphaera mucosa]MDG3004403.1 carbon storage regulator [Paludisphaera mucosa]